MVSMKRKRSVITDGDEDDQELESRYSDVTYKQLRMKDGTLNRNLFVPPTCLQQIGGDVTPKEDLGQLKVLPLEILHELLAELDLQSLVRFKRVNRKAYKAAKSLPQMRAIEMHAATALNGALAIQTAHQIPCRTLYHALCTSECEECGDFCTYLYVLTCKRICYMCFAYSSKFLPLRVSHAVRKYGIDRKDVQTLPCMRSLPGTYSSNLIKFREAATLVDRVAALEKGVSIHGSVGKMEKFVQDQTEATLLAYEAKAARWHSNPSSAHPRKPMVEDPWDAKSGNPLRFVAMVETPYLNLKSNKAEWGFHCLGCKDLSKSDGRQFRRRFSEATFRAHLEQYGKVVASEQRICCFEHRPKLPPVLP